MKYFLLSTLFTAAGSSLFGQSIPPEQTVPSTAITPSATHREFIVYPNPSNGQELFINLTGFRAENLLVVVTDLYGNELFSKVLVYEEGGILYSTDPSNTLKPGVYLVTATANDDIYRQKIVVR
jgi:hypothetical protein